MATLRQTSLAAGEPSPLLWGGTALERSGHGARAVRAPQHLEKPFAADAHRHLERRPPARFHGFGHGFGGIERAQRAAELVGGHDDAHPARVTTDCDRPAPLSPDAWGLRSGYPAAVVATPGGVLVAASPPSAPGFAGSKPSPRMTIT